jgi:hypothetical protein
LFSDGSLPERKGASKRSTSEDTITRIPASNQGLGYLIESVAKNFNAAGVFAGLIVLSVVTWFLTWLMRKIEARILPLEAFRRECLA